MALQDSRRASSSLAEEEKKEDDATTTKQLAGMEKSDPSFGTQKLAPAPNAFVATTARETNSLRRPRRVFVFLAAVLHIVLLDCPLLLVSAGHYATLLLEHVCSEFILPQMDLQLMTETRKSRELTYFHRTCTERDLTAMDSSELTIDYDNMSTDDAMYHMLQHGVSVYPNLLSDLTASEVRDFILRQNEKNEDMISVIENENRWSFGIRVDQDPSIPKALTEILSNEFLVQSIEKIMGPNPSIIEFTGITSAYGAKMQRYHADVVPEGNGAKWGRTFIPSYSLFIPLQNITSAMGATEICPGSHMCADGVFNYCPDHGFQVSGKRNNWPLGAGALVNQQLMHRGQAHSDPEGPHRVLFIITFAPRPRFGNFEVETRSLAQGGSYSLHWQQWGHTLRDFADAPRHMPAPWRFFRSMGLWKAYGRQWGWDYITTATARIANSETGFFYTDLLEMLENNQFNLLPMELLGDVSDEGESSRDVWVPFYLSTLSKCQEAMKLLHRLALGTYLVLALSISFMFSKRKRARDCSFKIIRVVLIHLLVFLLSKIALTHVHDSTYGKNIKYGRSYHWPSSPQSHAPDLPGTLPSIKDVLVPDDLQSEYLASYTEVLDVVHPGNKVWHSTLMHFSSGYDSWSPIAQRELCFMLKQWSLSMGSRILVKNRQNQWAVASDEIALRYCHKELMKRTNPYLRQVIRQLDFLLSETKFGYWRETQLHRRHLPAMLRKLQDAIMRFQNAPIALNHHRETKGATLRTPAALSRVSAMRSIERNPWPLEQKGDIPPRSDVATFQVGDIVEAAYASLRTEWYLAKVIGVDAHELTWEVEYQDGERETSLCTACVRMFLPYQIGEEDIECRVQGELLYSPCEVLADHGDGAYKVQLSNLKVIEKFESKSIRRIGFLSDGVFALGDEVMAPYYDSGLYPAVVLKVNEDATYGIEFIDGEFVPSIAGRLMVHRGDDNFDDDDEVFDEDLEEDDDEDDR